MTDDLPARKRRWRAWLILFGALAAAGGGFGVWLDRAADRRWERMVRRVAELKAEAEGRERARPAFGEPLDGDAWEDYEKAAKGYASELNTSMRGLEVDATLFPALHLRRGARCREIRLPDRIRWGGDRGPHPALGYWILRGTIASEKKGGAGQTVWKCLDLCQYARDLAHDSNLDLEDEAHDLYGEALTLLEGEICGPALAGERLKEVERRLAVLDGNFPDHRTVLKNELSFQGERYSRWVLISRGELVSPSGMRTWRHAWNARVGVTDAFDRQERWTARRVAAEAMPWSEAQEELRKVAAEELSCRNPLARVDQDHAGDAAEEARFLRIRVRLLRIAAHYRATGEVMHLDDPFGGQLRTQDDGGSLHAWSIGPDGLENSPMLHMVVFR